MKKIEYIKTDLDFMAQLDTLTDTVNELIESHNTLIDELEKKKEPEVMHNHKFIPPSHICEDCGRYIKYTRQEPKCLCEYVEQDTIRINPRCPMHWNEK